MSHQLSSVSSYVVDLKRVKKSGGSVIQGIIQDNQPLTEPKDPKGAALRRNYERPTTTCSTQRYDSLQMFECTTTSALTAAENKSPSDHNMFIICPQECIFGILLFIKFSTGFLETENSTHNIQRHDVTQSHVVMSSG